ncbi:ScbR family autoregulator-binding transcription factor [Streptomyces sp. ME02-6991-2A]|uniref:ScbR family autoregulator-binding transcription factor n=1 Tax=Streptomyces TaxID=1883 RepID=UPI0010082A65|nr:ScbR family autoregulator-binding transcription factor [Streptomyces sp. ME02-6991-2A]MDX3372960.1 ScbR family autoregulator-binding transcription factor [Streptomyces sp. ME02-6991-2A]
MAKQDRAVRTRQELIRCAAETFYRRGFALSSLSEISGKAGVSTGALNFHFQSKRELGEAVEVAASETLRRITGPRPSHCPVPLQALVDTTHELARYLSEDPILRAGFSLGHDAAWSAGDGGPLWPQWESWVLGALAVAGEAGNLAADVALDDAGAAVTAAVVGFEVLGRIDARWFSHRTVTHFWELMLPRLASTEIGGELDAGGAGAPAGPTPRGDAVAVCRAQGERRCQVAKDRGAA